MHAYKYRFPRLEHKGILSPMAGVTDVAFRTLCKRYGAGLTVTEFLSATAIVRDSGKTKRMLVTDESEKPVAVQLFGHDEADVVQAAQDIQSQFDIIDINCGCPAWKVIKSGAGSAMLEDGNRIHSFVAKLVNATAVPITVKIRIGIDAKNINAVQVAQLVEEAGASAIAVHGRTQKQGYSGVADWDVIKAVKDAVSIPVIGNGDVFTPETFKKRLSESGVDYIMVARGAIGKPYLFQQINEYLKNDAYNVLTNTEQLNLFDAYLELAHNYDIPFSQIKIHAQSFTTGQTGAGKFRAKLVGLKTSEELRAAMVEYRQEIEKSEHHL